MKKIIVLIFAIFLLTGCTSAEEKVLNSLNILTEKNYYIIYTNMFYGDFNLKKDVYNAEFSYTFDEKTKVAEKSVVYFDEPYSTERVKIQEDSIIRYYGEVTKHEEYEESYYLPKWQEEKLTKSEENLTKYQYFDKYFYKDLLTNAKKYIRVNDQVEVLMDKKDVQKIVNSISDIPMEIKNDVRAMISLDSDGNISSVTFDIKKDADIIYDYCSLIVSFQTDFGDLNDLSLDLPKS